MFAARAGAACTRSRRRTCRCIRRREVGERLVGEFPGHRAEQVLLTNGMDEALSLVFTSYLGPKDETAFRRSDLRHVSHVGEAMGAQVVGRKPPKT